MLLVMSPNQCFLLNKEHVDNKQQGMGEKELRTYSFQSPFKDIFEQQPGMEKAIKSHKENCYMNGFNTNKQPGKIQYKWVAD